MVQRVKYVAKRKSRPFAFRYRSPPGKVELAGSREGIQKAVSRSWNGSCVRLRSAA
jgi:hypothetical protein